MGEGVVQRQSSYVLQYLDYEVEKPGDRKAWCGKQTDPQEAKADTESCQLDRKDVSEHSPGSEAALPVPCEDSRTSIATGQSWPTVRTVPWPVHRANWKS